MVGDLSVHRKRAARLPTSGSGVTTRHLNPSQGGPVVHLFEFLSRGSETELCPMVRCMAVKQVSWAGLKVLLAAPSA